MNWIISEQTPLAEYSLCLKERQNDVDRFGQPLYTKILKEFETENHESAKQIFEEFMDNLLENK